MSNHYDIIIIGAGHNGLIAAAYLARAGKSVLVLERRSIVGGLCALEMPRNGQPVGGMLMSGALQPDIIRDLNLLRFGVNPDTETSSPGEWRKLISPLPGSGQLILERDVKKTAQSIASISRADAARWQDFAGFMDKAAAFLNAAYKTPMPRLPKFPLADGLPLAQLGLKLRGMGAQDMYKVIRLLPMTAREFLDEWFESDALKAAIASLGIHNANLGVMSAGSAYNLLHQFLIRGGWAQPIGGDRIPAALAAAARERGVEIRTSADVTKILVRDGRALGVVLTTGEELTSSLVISSADPKHTLLKLVAPEHLDPEFAWRTSNILMRGVTARVFATIDGDQSLPPGTLVVAPSLDYLEHAYDAAKYGRISEYPYLEVTTSGGVVSIHMQFAPYYLKNGTWDAQTRAILEKAAVDTLCGHFPALKSRIQVFASITPLELESTYGLSEGDPHHGQLMLNQFFFLRPLPGWSQHKTPIDGLYLCGSGVHGGGGISGIPGRNAAKQVLKPN